MQHYLKVREALRELEPFIDGAIHSVTSDTTTTYGFVVPEGKVWSLVKRRLNDKKIKFAHAHGLSGRIIKIFCDGSLKQDSLKQIGQLLDNFRKRQEEQIEANEDSQKS